MKPEDSQASLEPPVSRHLQRPGARLPAQALRGDPHAERPHRHRARAGEAMTHICPACGKQWICECPETVKALHRAVVGAHDVEIACSEKCAEHLAALLSFLARRMR